jgi:hypothetical protein
LIIYYQVNILTILPGSLRNRLLALGVFKEECSSCGYDERRITDDTVPLLLDHIDGDETNHCVENLQMLC